MTFLRRIDNGSLDMLKLKSEVKLVCNRWSVQCAICYYIWARFLFLSQELPCDFMFTLSVEIGEVNLRAVTENRIFNFRLQILNLKWVVGIGMCKSNKQRENVKSVSLG